MNSRLSSHQSTVKQCAKNDSHSTKREANKDRRKDDTLRAYKTETICSDSDDPQLQPCTEDSKKTVCSLAFFFARARSLSDSPLANAACNIQKGMGDIRQSAGFRHGTRSPFKTRSHETISQHMTEKEPLQWLTFLRQPASVGPSRHISYFRQYTKSRFKHWLTPSRNWSHCPEARMISRLYRNADWKQDQLTSNGLDGASNTNPAASGTALLGEAAPTTTFPAAAAWA